MHLFGNFHDGCVREIHVATGHYVGENLSMRVDWRTTATLLIQRQWADPSAIELRFEEVVGLWYRAPLPNYTALIFRASFFLRNGIFYWAESGDWRPESPERDEVTWVSGRRVWWRDAS